MVGGRPLRDARAQSGGGLPSGPFVHASTFIGRIIVGRAGEGRDGSGQCSVLSGADVNNTKCRIP